MINNNDRFKTPTSNQRPQNAPVGVQHPNVPNRPYSGIQRPININQNIPTTPIPLYSNSPNPNAPNRLYVTTQAPLPQIRPFISAPTPLLQIQQYPVMPVNPYPTLQMPQSQNQPYIGVQNQKEPIHDSKKISQFKKKAFIVTMCSLLGIGAIVTTATLVSLHFVNNLSGPSISLPILNNAKFIYNTTDSIANINVTGKNLPTNKNLFAISNATNSENKTLINSSDITISGTANDINLIVYDPSITPSSIYEIAVTGVGTIVSSPKDNIAQPTFSITTQPRDQIVWDFATTSVDLSISTSEIANEIRGETLSYQWYISNTNDVSIGTAWDEIPNSDTPNLRFNISNLVTRKYFRCKVSYKYAYPVFSTVALVEKTTSPVISVIKHPESQTIAYNAETPLLTVVANIVNPTTENLSYQWYSSTNGNDNWTRIQNATAPTYKVESATTVKKYYRCELSYVGAKTITTNVAFVKRDDPSVLPPTPAPTLTFTRQPISTAVSYEEVTLTLDVAVRVDNLISGIEPTYQWFISDSISGNFTPISNATQPVFLYTLNSQAHSIKKYFKCEVNYIRATAITSDVVFVYRDPPQ